MSFNLKYIYYLRLLSFGTVYLDSGSDDHFNVVAKLCNDHLSTPVDICMYNDQCQH